MADDDQQNEFKKALAGLSEQQEKILAQQQTMLTQLAESQTRNRKDAWDRIGAIAPILSGTILAIGGTFFTMSYNQQQLKLQEAQTIERFIPHLLGDEKSKRAAILAISSLTDAKLAGKVASIFASPGTVSALESLAENDTSPDRKALKSALARTLDNMAGNFIVEKRYDDAIITCNKALGLQEQSFGVNSPELVPNLNRLAELYTIHKDYPSAETCLKRSAEIQKSSSGADSMQFASELRRLSALYKEQGFDSKSQSIMNQAIAIEQKSPATSSGGGLGVAADPHAGLSDHSSAGSDFSSAANADKSGRAAESSNDSHSEQLDADSSARSTNETGAVKSSGSEHSQPKEIHGQDLPNKSFESPETEPARSHESSVIPAAHAEQLSEKQH